MTSKKLDSKSKPTRRKPSLKRTRALKRHNIQFDTLAIRDQQGKMIMAEEYLPYLWAACKRGAFNSQAGFRTDLEPRDFALIMSDRVEHFLNAGGEVVVPVARIGNQQIPVGVISIARQENRAYPHVIWFPEASARLRLEIGVKFVVELKKQALVLITAVERDIHYFRHLARYGLLKAVGKIQGYTSAGEDVMLFQSAGS